MKKSQKRQEKKGGLTKIVILSCVALLSIAGLAYYVVSNSINTEAKIKKGKSYYWCSSYKNGQLVNRYCYGNSNQCQTYNLYTKKPKDNLKKGVTYNCLGYKVYVTRKGAPCPPDDYVIENEHGSSVGCFGGFKETNKKILE